VTPDQRRKLLELAGWTSKAWTQMAWHEELETHIDLLRPWSQWLAEQVADAVLEDWTIWSEGHGQVFSAYPSVDDCEHGHYGPTRAEAIEAMLENWITEKEAHDAKR